MGRATPANAAFHPRLMPRPLGAAQAAPQLGHALALTGTNPPHPWHPSSLLMNHPCLWWNQPGPEKQSTCPAGNWLKLCDEADVRRKKSAPTVTAVSHAFPPATGVNRAVHNATPPSQRDAAATFSSLRGVGAHTPL